VISNPRWAAAITRPGNPASLTTILLPPPSSVAGTPSRSAQRSASISVASSRASTK
jgi:hypothetical protein